MFGVADAVFDVPQTFVDGVQRAFLDGEPDIDVLGDLMREDRIELLRRQSVHHSPGQAELVSSDDNRARDSG